VTYGAHLRLAGKPVLVVGGGRVALGKVAGLLEGGADEVTVVAPDVAAGFQGLPVTIERRRYEAGEAVRYRLVMTATDDPAVNALVAADADAAGVWVNSADDPANCTFFVPARVRGEHFLVTIGTGGRSPAAAAWLRSRLAADLDPAVDELIAMLGEERERIRSSGRSTEGLDWSSALDSGMLELLRQGRRREALELLRTCLSSSSG
jgi:precorrin-2 dehydrogenase/sirohydrochlorin ferrochelatase